MPKERKREASRSIAGDGAGAQASDLEYASGAGFLLRLYWMGPGNLLLVFLAGSISRVSNWSLTFRDLAYWITVATLLAARYVDVARYDGLTINSEPATQQHVRRYAVLLLVIAAAVWSVAQSFKT